MACRSETTGKKTSQQDSRARQAGLEGKARHSESGLAGRAFLARLALHVPRFVALADFFSILLSPGR